MGLTERHWFENEEPKLTAQQLEDIVYENKKAYDNGYAKGFRDASVLLKKQEAVKPIITPWAENEDGEVVIAKKECGRCGYHFFTEKPNYCENCGAPILWETNF